MYFLRKVHKIPHQLRPIVSCCSGPTQKLSQLANHILRNYLGTVPSLITSSTQVIHALENLCIPADSRNRLLLATLDVKSLYPSIPHGVGVTMALQQAMPTNPPITKEHRLKHMLREMLLLLLKDNTFEFAGRYFKQIKGAAMGTPVAPTLANLFMGKLEATALNSWTGTQPILWLRYIDDVLLLLQDSEDTLTDLVAHLNSQMASIKFTFTCSNNSIDFLDITLYKGPRYLQEGRLDIRPYSKKIDPHAYLHYSSAHHRAVTAGMVKEEVIRTLRRCSSPETFATAIQLELEKWFSNRGYPKKLLKDVLATVKYSDREYHLMHRENRGLPELTTVLSVRNHPAIRSSEVYEALYDPDLPFRPMVARKKPACTGELVTRAKTPTLESAHSYNLRTRPVERK